MKRFLYLFFSIKQTILKTKVGSVYKEMPAGKLLSPGMIVFARFGKLGFKYFHAFIKGAFFLNFVYLIKFYESAYLSMKSIKPW